MKKKRRKGRRKKNITKTKVRSKLIKEQNKKKCQKNEVLNVLKKKT